jgi:hypothetical protein
MYIVNDILKYVTNTFSEFIIHILVSFKGLTLLHYRLNTLQFKNGVPMQQDAEI